MPESVTHIICDCPIYAAERDELRSCFARLDTRPFCVTKVLGACPNVKTAVQASKALLAFVRATTLRNVQAANRRHTR